MKNENCLGNSRRFQGSLYHVKNNKVVRMSEKINAIDFTEDLYVAIKDYFIGVIECGVTDITVTFLTNDKFKITVEKL